MTRSKLSLKKPLANKGYQDIINTAQPFGS